MNTTHRDWLFRVVYNTDAGRIEVDYFVDTLKEAHLAIEQGPHGLAAVVFMGMMRNTADDPPTLESLERKVDGVVIPLGEDD